MIKRNKLLILTLSLLIVFSAGAQASTGSILAEVTDGVNGIIKITGTSSNEAAGESVNLLVTHNSSLKDAQGNPEEKVQYQNSLVTDENGNFSVEFQLNLPEDSTGEETFKIFAGGQVFSSGNVVETSVYYASIDLKLTAAKNLVEAVSGGSAILETNKEVFSINSSLYASLDKSSLETYLKNSFEENEIEFLELNDANKAKNIETYTLFEKTLRTAIAVEGFNQGKKENLVDNGVISADALLGLTDYLKANGNLYSVYTESVANPSLVVDGLFGMNAKSVEDLNKIFAKQVILQGIKNNVKGGSGVIDSILTEDNIKAAGLNVPKYKALTSKAAANNALYNKRSALTFSNLEAEIEAAADVKPSVSGPTGGGGGGGGTTGSKKGSGSVSVSASSSGSSAANSYTGAFADLNGYEWANTAINTLADRNILSGVGNAQFNPAGTLTREAAAKIICLAVGISAENTQNAFSDVDSNMWYAPYITALTEKAVVNGITDDVFGIGRDITREDFAVIICRALNLTATTDSNFSDKSDISSYAMDAVNALYEKGIVSGYSDGSFKPKATITRAEGAVIIYNILTKSV